MIVFGTLARRLRADGDPAQPHRDSGCSRACAALCQRGCLPWPGEALPCGPEPTLEPAGISARSSPSLLTSSQRYQALPCPEAPLAQTPALHPRVPLSKRKVAAGPPGPGPASGSSQNTQLTPPHPTPRRPSAWHPTSPGPVDTGAAAPLLLPGRVLGSRQEGRPATLRAQEEQAGSPGPLRCSSEHLAPCTVGPRGSLRPPPLHPSGPFGVTSPYFSNCPLHCPPPALA